MIHKTHKDKRGIIRDLLVGKKGAVTYITFAKGAVRANHYHKKTVQYDFILSGKLLCSNGKKQIKVSAGEIITHPKNTPHAYKALEKSEMISLVYGPRKGEDFSKDTFKLKTPLL
jgi:quercetin dioxygenase-like cupin family protein